MDRVSRDRRQLGAPTDTEQADRLGMLRHSELDLMIAIEDESQIVADAEGRIASNRRDMRAVREEIRLLERVGPAEVLV